MEQIYERTKQLKMQTLDLLERRIKLNPANDELLVIAKIINETEEDKSFYAKAMSKLYSGGNSWGFGGSATSTTTTTLTNGESANKKTL